MKHYPSMPSWKKLIAALSVTMLSFSSIATADAAAILFQNDAEFEMDSDNLVIDFDDTTRTTGDVYIDFGNGAGTNGRINWSMDDNRFEIANDVQLTGKFDASASTGFRMREHGFDLNGGSGLTCNNVNELAFRTDTKEMYYCDQVGPLADSIVNFDVDGSTAVLTNGTTAGLYVGQVVTGTGIQAGSKILSIDSATQVTLTLVTTVANTAQPLTFEDANWKLIGATGQSSSFVMYANDAAATAGFNPPVQGDVYYNTTTNQVRTYNGSTWVVVGPQDFESVFAADGDGTLTTGNSNFTINTGAAGDLTFSTDVFTANANTLDFNLTSGDITSSGTFAISSSNWGITSAGNASLVDITGTGNIDFTNASSVQIKEIAADPNVGPEACTSTGELIFSTTLNVAYVCTNSTTDTWAALGGSGQKSTQLAWDPQYPNAVIWQDGTLNSGVFLADYDSTNAVNFYRWRSTNAALQDDNLRFRFTLPADYRDAADMTYRLRTNTGANADNKMDVVVRNITDAQTCFTQATQVSTAATWVTKTITEANLESGCTGFSGGDVIEIDFKFYSKSSNGTDLGRLVYDYET